jgi:methionine synthase II (cobalamin-independent)
MGEKEFSAHCWPTAIGSLPHQDPEEACHLMLRYFPLIPLWPQLPKRSFRENMYVQYSKGFPGVVLTDDERIYVDRSADLSSQLEKLYTAYIEQDTTNFALEADYAAGLHFLLGRDFRALTRLGAGTPLAIKGQVTGPISWGLTVTDQDRRAVLYDEVLADAIAKHLRLSAIWQEKALQQIHPQTIVFIDEPYMSAYGSAFVSLQREQVITLLEEVFQGLEGLTGIHCCGNTDWSLLVETSVDILNLDAYNHAESLSLYPEAIDAFLRRGGIIAWGIVPVSPERLANETAESLVGRLEQAMGLLVKKGIGFDNLVRHCLITPACGLGTVSVDNATRALELTAQVAAEMRRRYFTEVPS